MSYTIKLEFLKNSILTVADAESTNRPLTENAMDKCYVISGMNPDGKIF